MIIVHNYDYGNYQENVRTYKFDIAMLSFSLFCALDSPDKADKDALLNVIQVNFPHVGQILLCLKSRYHPHYLLWLLVGPTCIAFYVIRLNFCLYIPNAIHISWCT